MTQQQIKEAQEKFLALQSQIQETIYSPEKDIKVIMNGKVEIVDIEISGNKNIEQLKPCLIDTINRAIKNVSEKIQSIMLAMQVEIQNNVPK